MSLIETYAKLKLVELMEYVKFWPSDKQLEALLRAAKITKVQELEAAIELYWQNEADALTVQDYIGGGEIKTANEMRQIAKALIAKADEIEEKYG